MSDDQIYMEAFVVQGEAVAAACDRAAKIISQIDADPRQFLTKNMIDNVLWFQSGANKGLDSLVWLAAECSRKGTRGHRQRRRALQRLIADVSEVNDLVESIMVYWDAVRSREV